MKLEFTPYPRQEETAASSDRAATAEAAPSGANKRSDARCGVEAKAFVAIPGLTSRSYDIVEVSRGGMFLRFREVQSTLLDFEQNGVEAGVSVEVAFAVSLPDGPQRFSVRGRISRITRQGIGVQFATRNPPQLAALREVFAARPERPGSGAAAPARDITALARGDSKRTLEKPSEDAAWSNWELLD